MSKIGIALIALGAGAFAGIIWLLPLGYVFQVVLLGLVAGFLSYAGKLSWTIWGPALVIPSIAQQAIVMTRLQGWPAVWTVQGLQWAMLVLAVALGGIAGGAARRRESTPGGPLRGSRRWFYVGVPLAALASAIAFTAAGFADPIIIEFGLILIGGPAVLLGVVCLYRRWAGAANVFFSITLFFALLVPLHPLAERAGEVWSLRVLRKYCETLVPMLHHVKTATGDYPHTLSVPPFNEVETPGCLNDEIGGVLYATDEKRFNFVVYRRKPPYLSQTYDSETERWIEGTHYPSSHEAQVLPSRTRVVTIDGAGKQTVEWR